MDLFNPGWNWPEELKTEARKFRELNYRLRILSRDIESVSIDNFPTAFEELERCREAESAQWRKCLRLHKRWLGGTVGKGAAM